MTLRLPPLTVISVPLPLTDRRALSQAWYSALHLASQGQVVREYAQRGAANEPAPAALRTRSPRLTSAPRAARAASSRGSRAPSNAAVVAPDRRTPPSVLGRRIARAIVRRTTAHQFAPFTLTAGSGARVTVVLRAASHGIALIALCAPDARRAVERALAEARYALGARGVVLAAELRERAGC